MIRNFRHKGLAALFEMGRGSGVRADMRARCVRILDLLDQAGSPEDMNVPGYRFHALRGRPRRFSVRATSNYRITFGWDGDDAVGVDLEDYH